MVDIAIGGQLATMVPFCGSVPQGLEPAELHVVVEVYLAPRELRRTFSPSVADEVQSGCARPRPDTFFAKHEAA